ncbi:MAG: STAS domain-containing protein [Patescibacteria group bacterium]
MAPCQLEIIHESDITIIKLSGALLFHDDGAELCERVDEILGQGIRKIILDMSGNIGINSNGFGSLISILVKITKAGGQLILFNPKDKVLNLITIVKLTKTFVIFHGTLDEAKRHFRTVVKK